MILNLLLNVPIKSVIFIKIKSKYNSGKIRRILTVFDDMITDILNNKKLNSIVTELFVICRKRNIYVVFSTQLYFAVPKYIRLNSTRYENSKQKRESFVRY